MRRQEVKLDNPPTSVGTLDVALNTDESFCFQVVLVFACPEEKFGIMYSVENQTEHHIVDKLCPDGQRAPEEMRKELQSSQVAHLSMRPVRLHRRHAAAELQYWR